MPNVMGTCWFSSLLTALLHSDRLMVLCGQCIMHGKSLAVVSHNQYQFERTVKACRLPYDLKLMLAHTMAQRSNPSEEVVFVDPAELLTRLYRLDPQAFPVAPREGMSCGGDALVYLCELLDLLNISCSTYMFWTYSNVRCMVGVMVKDRARLFPADISSKQKAFCQASHPHEQIRATLQRRLESDDKTLPVMLAVVAGPSDSGLSEEIHFTHSHPNPQDGTPWHDKYVLDACIMEFPEHSICGITMDGESMLHENQAQDQSFQLTLLDAEGKMHARLEKKYTYGCPYVNLDWKDWVVNRGKSCIGRNLQDDNVCGFNLGQVGSKECSSSDPQVRTVQEVILLYVLQSAVDSGDDVRQKVNAMAESFPQDASLQRQMIEPDGLRTVTVLRNASTKARIENTRRRFFENAAVRKYTSNNL